MRAIFVYVCMWEQKEVRGGQQILWTQRQSQVLSSYTWQMMVGRMQREPQAGVLHKGLFGVFHRPL